MNTSKSITVPVGTKKLLETWTHVKGFRDPRQFETVAKIVAEPDFDFSCLSKLFEPEPIGHTYSGYFVFGYYTKDGKHNMVKVLANGSIKFRLKEGAASHTMVQVR